MGKRQLGVGCSSRAPRLTFQALANRSEKRTAAWGCPCRGTLFLQYELQEELGQGAFGRAVRARRRRDGQPVVVKIMHPDTLSDSVREEARHCKGLRSNTLALQNLTFLAYGVVCMCTDSVCEEARQCQGLGPVP